MGNVSVVKTPEKPLKEGGKPGTKTTTTTYDVDPDTGDLINPKTTVKTVYPWEDLVFPFLSVTTTFTLSIFSIL